MEHEPVDCEGMWREVRLRMETDEIGVMRCDGCGVLAVFFYGSGGGSYEFPAPTTPEEAVRSALTQRREARCTSV